MEAVPPDSIFRKQSLIWGLRLSIVFVYPLIDMLFLTIWHVWTQLSLAGDKLRLVMVNLYISEYVIDEVCQSVGCFGSHHSDAANKWAVHCSLYESEDVLNAASCQVFTHRLAVYSRFLHNSVWFLLQRYYFLSKYQNKYLIISKLIYRTSLMP